MILYKHCSQKEPPVVNITMQRSTIKPISKYCTRRQTTKHPNNVITQWNFHTPHTLTCCCLTKKWKKLITNFIVQWFLCFFHILQYLICWVDKWP